MRVTASFRCRTTTVLILSLFRVDEMARPRRDLPYKCRTMGLVLTVFYLTMTISSADPWPASNISPTRGHYPGVFCKVTNALLDSKNRVFRYTQDTSSKHTFDSACGPCAGVWMMEQTAGDVKQCAETYDEGYVFTIYFHHGSNYFHLHYDMMIPLFSLVQNQKKIMMMPSVESSRLRPMYWDTVAFKDHSKYWYQMLEVLSSPHTLQPLDGSLQENRGNICFKTLHFGTPSFSKTDKDNILQYIYFIKARLNIPHERLSTKRIGIIKRTNRRKILNEEELVKAVSSFANVELIEFSGVTFKEQVEKVQDYAVFVGMNGAGLMNGLFLSPGAVAVQLVPYKADVNFKEFAALLKNRGPYLEWHNEHEDLTVAKQTDPYRGQSDTTVKVDEFVELMKKALDMVNSDEFAIKSEL